MSQITPGLPQRRIAANAPLPSELDAVSFLSREAANANIPFPDAWSIAETIANKLEIIARSAGDHPNRHKYGGF